MGHIFNLYKRFGGASLLREYLTTGFLFKAPLQLLATGLSDKGLELFREAASLSTYRYLEKHYAKYLPAADDCTPPVQCGSRKVWIFWWQGMDGAPRLVRQCYRSVCQYLGEWEVVLITKDNYKDYVSFPPRILEKLESGAITLTHFSDLLRIELLINHGGLWLDATVLCTGGAIPPSILDSELFVYQTQKPGSNGHATQMSSWCMWARPGNSILRATRTLLYAYWQRNDRLLNYFLLHHFFTLACKFHADEARQIPPYTNETPHILLLHFFDAYRPSLWEDWKRQTCFHKLSYKLDPVKERQEDTFYAHIVKAEGEQGLS